ncbi:MAG: tRNA-dihydrouridine synthase family protein [Eubacteriales bacterium]|nr:tRNA-dihydrouridine synthase family protein [Eubacteriales bacterium]
MRYEFAPLEGITGYIYRNAHQAFFPSMDAYYTPFLTPKKGKGFTAREKNDIAAEHNRGIRVIPQLLTNRPEGFLAAAERLAEQGFSEVNLNLGCPSGTVAAKKKGAAFLGEPEELDRFLEAVFRDCPLEISVKTRIGVEAPEEFDRLLPIFNRYPIKQLTIHPRVLRDFYKNSPRLEVFARAQAESENPVCYNGDLFCRADVERFSAQFPETDCLMLGRGMLINPMLVENLRENSRPEVSRIRAFYGRLAEDYREVLSGERDVLFKLKELWSWQGQLFEGAEKHLKRLCKTQSLAEYQAAAEALFAECPVKEKLP